jgi:hypothetical protein
MRIARADECAYAMGELAAQWSFEGASISNKFGTAIAPRLGSE